MDYAYELRDDDGAIVATGQLSVGHELTLNEMVPFGADRAVVAEVRPSLDGITRVVLKLRR